MRLWRTEQRAWKRKRKKEIAWSKVRDKHWDNKTKREIELYGSKLKQQYGFLADPSTKLWENVEDYYGSMDVRTYLIDRPTTMACHNLCSKSKAPEGIEFLLGLGAKYCVQRTKLDPCQLDKTMTRLRNNMRWKYIFRNQPDDSDYLPELYINSKRNPDEASPEIEACMNEF